MIKVELVGGATQPTLAPVTAPHFNLDFRRNDASAFRIFNHSVGRRRLLGQHDQFELEDQPRAIGFLPRIHEMEHSVIGPNTLLDFLVNTNYLRVLMTSFVLMCGSEEETVLG